MAQYQHIPVFQAAYKMNIEICRWVDNFPRLHRYSTGNNLKNFAFDLMSLIAKANSSTDKKIVIEAAEETLEKIRLSVRLCYDLKIMGGNGFENLSRFADDIGRQLSGWKNYKKKN